ncbi:ribonuclease, partial [Burkholderia pseudomallei]
GLGGRGWVGAGDDGGGGGGGVSGRAGDPGKGDKGGAGWSDGPVAGRGTRIVPGDWIYADADGVLVSDDALLE